MQKDIYSKIEDQLEDGVIALYKKKAKFHKSRYARLNTNHIICARLIKAVILIIALVWWIATMGMQVV